ncbi:gamma-glutamyl-gamma-aminobutyrate hydrolase family protein [Homoserinimonas sp. OAct 916]|uniref:gamma-glutamyl-gamma-aminobutyrate hydrolase family protein n=1 Tax=Homoserinimonas sp. OAct 916 TaxID=2211450 RepID=UPI000DBE7D97|nr:gamma-glutamyl-gamma-aminobutyrate hydrolase family protein [Homoserinimonas sp. OAct 916]
MAEGLPLIGVSTYRQAATWSGWRDVPADVLSAEYAESVRASGGVPVLIPPVATEAQAHAVVSRLDALIIAGGADIAPARYGAEVDPSVTVWYDDRDASELWLLDAAETRQLPVFGICRGMQLMAVRSGGTLIQHLPDVVGHEDHSGPANGYGQVLVEVASGHRISELVPAVSTVPCHHHQAVASHPGFIATAHAQDGTMEAMEAPGPRFVVAVQWHPETANDKRLFQGLVAAASQKR